ncbi:prolyl 4-hydroxylase subunit alpha-1 [Drosophila madeirensis]|uniref:procollagen-proline 4-dioxygenase n=1 Tax=Drosophila madeirensis TaxID=30013 RepID=A0AAU9FBJ8_DROMD
MKRLKCFLSLIFLWLPSVTLEKLNKNYAMSIFDLGELLTHSQVLVNQLEVYADKLQQRVDLVDSYIEIMKEKMAQAERMDSDPRLDPLSSFPFMRHMQSDWANILWHLEQQPGEAQATAISLLHSELPTAKDLRETIDGLFRIQLIYNLNGSDMARGILMGVQHNYSLTAFEVHTMAKYLVEAEEYIEARDWISVALDLYQADEANWDLYELQGLSSDSLFELHVEVLDNLSADKEMPLALMMEAVKRHPESHNLKRALTRLEMSVRIGEEPQGQEMEDVFSYFRCCSSECRRGSRLYCLYNSKATAFLRLAPLKMELLSLDPYVVLYHDVLSDSEMLALKTLAKGVLVRSVTYNVTKKEISEDPHRTTKGIKLDRKIDLTHSLVSKMEILTEDMTSLDLDSSEPFQVINYGIGGHYVQHADYFTENGSDPHLPDRIVTVLFYLSDVPLGGATVFPLINLSVMPKKGSALFWYNLNHRGHGMSSTYHSACPVVIGSKWIMTKWINRLPQLFRRPCLREQ